MDDEKLMSKLVETCNTRSEILKGLGLSHIRSICTIYNIQHNQSIEKMIASIVNILADTDGMQLKYFLISHDM